MADPVECTISFRRHRGASKRSMFGAQFRLRPTNSCASTERAQRRRARVHFCAKAFCESQRETQLQTPRASARKERSLRLGFLFATQIRRRRVCQGARSERRATLRRTEASPKHSLRLQRGHGCSRHRWTATLSNRPCRADVVEGRSEAHQCAQVARESVSTSPAGLGEGSESICAQLGVVIRIFRPVLLMFAHDGKVCSWMERLYDDIACFVHIGDDQHGLTVQD